jgi:hypothetical protein
MIWTSYIQGPRWVDLRKFITDFAEQYNCIVYGTFTETHFLKKKVYFNVVGNPQDVKVLQREILLHPSILEKKEVK